MKPLLIIKTGSTLPDLAQSRGDFEDWILAGMGVSRPDAIVMNVQQGEILPPPAKTSGAIITGSHDMVTDDHDWIAMTEEWLDIAAATDLPILGICFGHQLLVNALGGHAADNPNGLEYGSVEVRLNENTENDPLFSGMPSLIHAQVSHKQSAIELPPEAVHLATSDMDPNQAFVYRDHVWGVQFHPEFDREITRAYIHYAKFGLRLRGQNPDELINACRETPLAAEILRRFGELAS